MRYLFRSFAWMLAASLLLTSCTTMPDASSEGIVEDPSAYMQTNCTKDGVADFIQTHMPEADATLCYNVTPDDVTDMLGISIFKFADSCATFLCDQEHCLELGAWFGGYGFIDGVPCDLDGDGNWELLYTYSFGSGIHRCCAAHYDPITQTETMLFNSFDSGMPQMDCVIVPTSPSLVTKQAPIVTFTVYTADITRLDANFAKLGYTVSTPIGTIIFEEGKPTFRSI